MIERHFHALHLEDPGREEPAATRERLRALFPRGATRRMTQLGLLLGSVLEPLRPAEEDAIAYASSYGESRALHEYLASFPTASPTLFQTSIHPSAVQQVLVARQQPVREFFPFGGQAQIVAHAAQAALLSPAPRSILCGGEERSVAPGHSRTASAIAFAFALALGASAEGALGTLRLAESSDPAGELTLLEFFQALRDRRALDRAAAPGMRLLLTWR
jgi:hypothetical protein